MKTFAIVVAAIAAAVLSASSVAHAGLAAYWKLDETSGTTAYDATGNGHDAALVTSSPNGNAVPPTPGQTGIIGGAYLFNGTANSISALQLDNTTGLVGDSTTKNLTMNAWVYIPSATSDANQQPRLFQIDYCDYLGYVQDCSRSYLGFQPGFEADHYASPGGSPGFDGWHMLTGTYVDDPANGTGTCTLYLDGVNVGTAAGAWDNSVNTKPLGLGGWLGTNGFSTAGYLDDMGMWDEALTDTQVKAVHNTPLLAGLQATALYGQDAMAKLFGLYGAASGSATIGNLTWGNITGLTHTAGDAWESGGVYYLQLGTDGSGVATASGPAHFPGDANLDGKVDIQDLNRVLTNYDKSGMQWGDGDFDGNGTVNVTDLNKVLTNYDKTASAGMKAAPEPSSFALLAGGLLALLAGAWRKST